MKLYLSLTLLALLPLFVYSHDKEMQMLKKWAFAKAIGQCIGEDNMKKMMIMKKEAYRKCSGMPTPELELPIFKTPYRVASGVVNSAFDTHHQMMGDMPHVHGMPYGHLPPRPPYRGGDKDDDFMEKAMKRFFFKKIMKEMMESEFGHDDDEDQDMMPGGPMRFFKSARNKGHQHFRYRRDHHTSEDKNEIIEKLSEKLEMEDMKSRAELGNMTCMIRECGILDASNKLVDAEQIVRDMQEKFPIEDKWLAEELATAIRHCHGFASAVPQDMLDQCVYGPEFGYLGRVKFFKMCMKIAKAKTCMMKDVKDKVEANFGPADEIAKEVGIDSIKQLLPLMHKILYGDMDDE